MKELKEKVKNYFSGLKFNADSHTYNYKDRALSPVSSVVKRYVEYVDFDLIAENVAKKRSRLEGKLITKEMVIAEWALKAANACAKGTRVHNFGENFVPGDKPKDGYEASVIAFWDSIPDHIEPFMFELQMFSETFGVAGTADIILYNTKTGKFIIADYKTNEFLFKNFKGKKLLAPFDYLLENNYNKYQIQLSLYQLLFEQAGYEVESRRLIWLKDNGTFEVFKTDDLTDILFNELTIK